MVLTVASLLTACKASRILASLARQLVELKYSIVAYPSLSSRAWIRSVVPACLPFSLLGVRSLVIIDYDTVMIWVMGGSVFWGDSPVLIPKRSPKEFATWN